MAKITREQIIKINDKCDNGFKLDVECVLIHGEKKLYKDITIDENTKIEFKLQYYKELETITNSNNVTYRKETGNLIPTLTFRKWSRRDSESLWTSTDWGKEKEAASDRPTRKNISLLQKLTKNYNDDILKAIIKEFYGDLIEEQEEDKINDLSVEVENMERSAIIPNNIDKEDRCLYLRKALGKREVVRQTIYSYLSGKTSQEIKNNCSWLSLVCEIHNEELTMEYIKDILKFGDYGTRLGDSIVTTEIKEEFYTDNKQQEKELEKYVSFAKSLDVKEYQKYRRLALQDDFLVDCFNNNYSVNIINFIEFMHNELVQNDTLINFPYDFEVVEGAKPSSATNNLNMSLQLLATEPKQITIVRQYKNFIDTIPGFKIKDDILNVGYTIENDKYILQMLDAGIRNNNFFNTLDELLQYFYSNRNALINIANSNEFKEQVNNLYNKVSYDKLNDMKDYFRTITGKPIEIYLNPLLLNYDIYSLNLDKLLYDLNYNNKNVSEDDDKFSYKEFVYNNYGIEFLNVVEYFIKPDTSKFTKTNKLNPIYNENIEGHKEYQDQELKRYYSNTLDFNKKRINNKMIEEYTKYFIYDNKRFMAVKPSANGCYPGSYYEHVKKYNTLVDTDNKILLFLDDNSIHNTNINVSYHQEAQPCSN